MKPFVGIQHCIKWISFFSMTLYTSEMQHLEHGFAW
jgi:hypothetical protein